MTRAQRAAIVQEILREAFPHPSIPLNHHDAFSLLVAVALSAQCTDARVNLVTPELLRRAPDAASMAEMSWQELQPYIVSCGLSESKAKRLVSMAQILVEKHGGEVPDTFSALEALPGVGHKTASVVMNQVFSVPAFPVDTHIFRLARRWRLSRADTVEGVEADLKRCFSRGDWGQLHLQMIHWGRQFCKARACVPACEICKNLS